MLRKIDVSTSTFQVKLLKALATTNPGGGGTAIYGLYRYVLL